MSEERLIEIETKLAHQEQLLIDLNDVVSEQQATIMQLDELCKTLISRVRAMGEAVSTGNPGDERPPHY